MNELFRYFEKHIKLLLIPYILLMLMLFIPINFTVQTPGGLSEVEKLIEIDYDNPVIVEGTISSTYIMSIPRPTIFSFLIGYYNPYSTISVLSGTNAGYTNTEIAKISYLDMATSMDAAVIVAYQEASLDNDQIVLDYVEKILVYGKAEYLSHYDEIEFGDEFLGFHGDNDVFINTIEGISGASTAGETYTFTFRHADGTEYSVDLTKDADLNLFGITLKKYYIVNEETVYPKYTINTFNIGGPSGGLLQTLAIYQMLSTTDLTHGLKIAGTGTINYDGSVGYIGGVKQKIATAYLNHVDVFFIPYLDPNYYYDNYVEALRACTELGIDPTGWLVPVATFSDAVDYLKGLGE